MPRIHHVRFVKEFDVTIVADSLPELQAALEKHQHEFDDWSGDSDWQTQILDPLSVGNPDLIPKTFGEPEMGVDGKKILDIEDYKAKHPEYLEQVNTEALEVARRLTLARVNLKLPFPDMADTSAE